MIKAAYNPGNKHFLIALDRHEGVDIFKAAVTEIDGQATVISRLAEAMSDAMDRYNNDKGATQP